jgi:hypothetical protein
LEKDIRINRMRLCFVEHSVFDPKTWSEDLGWLKSNATGRDLGEVMFMEVKHIDSDRGLDHMSYEAVDLLDKAIQYGFEESPVYLLRADVHFYSNQNYGLALRDINKAIEKADSTVVDLLIIKADILARLGKFSESIQCLIMARRMLGAQKIPLQYVKYDAMLPRDFTKEIIYRFAANYEFFKTEPNHEYFLETIFQALLLKFFGSGWKVLQNSIDGSVVWEQGTVWNMFPDVANTIIEIVGVEFWRQHKDLMGIQ